MSLYQHGRRTKAPKGASTFFATLVIVGVVVLVAWWIVHNDIGAGSDTKTTVPIVTEVKEEAEDKIKIEESFFSFELPSDWKKVEHKVGNNINAHIYESTKKGADARRLEIHVDVMPTRYKVVRLQPLIPHGNTFSLGVLSSNCVNFAGGANRQSNAEFEAKWENITFICDPVTANQTIGTGTTEGGIRAALGRHSYFFYWEDHNIRPDDKIFIEALRSFVAK